MAQLSRADSNIAARIFHFLVTPSGTKIAHQASDLALYAEVPVAEVSSLLNRLAGQQVRILRGTSNGRYEIYHDVLAVAILDWRARYLQAIETARKRKRRRVIVTSILLLCLFIGFIVGFAQSPPLSGLRLLMGWLIAFSVVGEFALIPAWVQSRPARKQRI